MKDHFILFSLLKNYYYPDGVVHCYANYKEEPLSSETTLNYFHLTIVSLRYITSYCSIIGMSKEILFLGQYDKKNIQGRLFARVRDTCSREHLAIRHLAKEMVTLIYGRRSNLLLLCIFIKDFF